MRLRRRGRELSGLSVLADRIERNSQGERKVTLYSGSYADGRRFTRLVVTDAHGTVVGIATDDEGGAVTCWRHAGGTATRVNLDRWERAVCPSTPRPPEPWMLR